MTPLEICYDGERWMTAKQLAAVNAVQLLACHDQAEVAGAVMNRLDLDKSNIALFFSRLDRDQREKIIAYIEEGKADG